MPFTIIFAKTGRRDNNRIGEWFAINGNKRGAPLDGGERNGAIKPNALVASEEKKTASKGESSISSPLATS